LRHFYAASTGEAIQFDNACVVGVRYGVFFLFAVWSLDWHVQRGNGPAEAWNSAKAPLLRRHRRNFDVFFASQKTAIKTSSLLQFPARATLPMSRESQVLSWRFTSPVQVSDNGIMENPGELRVVA
jgi:hypothetical protein